MLQNILKDLDFIGDIPPDSKPNFSDKSYTFTSEWFSTFKRRMKNEQGEKGIVYVKNLIDNIYIIYNTLEIVDLNTLHEKLNHSLKGFSNLIETYKKENQKEVTNDYENLLRRINVLIVEITNDINTNDIKDIKDEKGIKKKFFSKYPSILK